MLHVKTIYEALLSFENNDVSSLFSNEGSIDFFPSGIKDEIAIHRIFLNDKFQKCGIFSNFLKYLSLHYRSIWLLQCNAIMSTILLTTKLKERYFTNRYTGEFYWCKNDDYRIPYNHEKAEMLALRFEEAKKLMKEDIEKFYHVVFTDDKYRCEIC